MLADWVSCLLHFMRQDVMHGSMGCAMQILTPGSFSEVATLSGLRFATCFAALGTAGEPHHIDFTLHGLNMTAMPATSTPSWLLATVLVGSP